MKLCYNIITNLFILAYMNCQKCGAELQEETRCCDSGSCCGVCCKCQDGEVDAECGCDK